MGYSTDFYGGFYFNKPIDEYLKNYINDYACTRHMLYDVKVIKENIPYWHDLGFYGNLGEEGEFITAYDNKARRYKIPNENAYIVDYNKTPKKCPELWAQWEIRDDMLAWDGGEKFYGYIKWLEFYIENFFKPKGYVLNGMCLWDGEDLTDKGYLIVYNNEICTRAIDSSLEAIKDEFDSPEIENLCDSPEIKNAYHSLFSKYSSYYYEDER